MVTARMLSVMAECRLWVLFLAILLLLSMLLGMAAAAVSVLGGTLQGGVAVGTVAALILGVVLLVFNGLPLVMLLLAFGRAGAFVATGRALELVDSVRALRNLWMVVGCLAIIQMLLIAVVFGVGLLAGSPPTDPPAAEAEAVWAPPGDNGWRQQPALATLTNRIV